jgi:hypothetical protein
VVAKSADEARRSALETWKTTGLPASGSTISNQGSSNGNLGFKGGQTGQSTATDPYAVDVLNMPPKDRLALSKLLKDAGYLRTASSKYNKNLADAYITASQEFATEAARTGRPGLTIREFLIENYQVPTGTGSGTPNLPSRSVYQYTEADRIKMIDDVSLTLRGQGITDADKSAKWYKDLKKSIDNMISTGTVSTSNKVKNPKTGKLEVKTVSTPGFSQEQAAAVAETAIRKATPEDVARKERVDFTSWMFNTLGGSRG